MLEPPRRGGSDKYPQSMFFLACFRDDNQLGVDLL